MVLSQSGHEEMRKHVTYNNYNNYNNIHLNSRLFWTQMEIASKKTLPTSSMVTTAVTLWDHFPKETIRAAVAVGGNTGMETLTSEVATLF